VVLEGGTVSVLEIRRKVVIKIRNALPDFSSSDFWEKIYEKIAVFEIRKHRPDLEG
jgi:hypothetical protein